MATLSFGQTTRWTTAQANAWYAKEPFLVGANYALATAINELEMWQADTFDPKTIDAELALAEGLPCVSPQCTNMCWATA